MRAENIAQLDEKLDQLFSRAGEAAGLKFQPRASDIIISPFAKCGTTWIQQTVHGLRTRGSMDFGEITEVTPWLEGATDLQLDLTSEQVALPRAFKSHLPWDTIPKGGKYICVFRDPINAMVSMYKFFEGWLMEPDAISFETFAYDHFLARQAPDGYWHHLVSWYNQKDNDCVMLLCYEHLQASFEPAIRRIADFMEIALDDELAALVHRQSSLAFMQENGSHFDDHFLRQRRDPVMGLASNSTSSKVSSTESRSSRPKPSQALRDDMQARWNEEVAAVTGLEDYSELLDVIHYD
ncbi:MAG: sulfotransferase domain-containing protein [Halioglobus sp.]